MERFGVARQPKALHEESGRLRRHSRQRVWNAKRKRRKQLRRKQLRRVAKTTRPRRPQLMPPLAIEGQFLILSMSLGLFNMQCFFQVVALNSVWVQKATLYHAARMGWWRWGSCLPDGSAEWSNVI